MKRSPSPVRVMPRDVRGLRYLPEALALTDEAGACDVSRAAKSAIGYVNWTEFYAEDLWSQPFLDRFANSERGRKSTAQTDLLDATTAHRRPKRWHRPEARCQSSSWLRIDWIWKTMNRVGGLDMGNRGSERLGDA